MYYIYHIPGIKIGCTDNVERRIGQQGFTDYQILEEHIDIFQASNRELSLQKKYGYKVDLIPYFKSVEQWGAKAGRIGGKKSAVIQRKEKIGLHTIDKQKRKEWGYLGANAVFKKYGKEHYSNMAKKADRTNSLLASSKPIIKLDINNNIIEYKSIMEASRDTGISFVAISNCLRGKSKTSGGYKWYYQKRK